MPSLTEIGTLVLEMLKKKTFQCIVVISLLSPPFEEGMAPSNEETYIPSQEDALHQVCLKLAQWF